VTDTDKLSKQVEGAMQAIHQLNVLHRDAEPRNMLWNSITEQAVVTDFELCEGFQIAGSAWQYLTASEEEKRVNRQHSRASKHRRTRGNHERAGRPPAHDPPL
jgi:serine/threonine protein kinase